MGTTGFIFILSMIPPMTMTGIASGLPSPELS